jgi:hypothetical protein
MAAKKEQKKKSSFMDTLGMISDVLEASSSIFKSKTLKFLNLTTKAYATISEKIDEELVLLKEKVKKVIIKSSFFVMSVFFILIGGTIYLEKLYPNLSNGLNFVVVGLVFFVIGLVYNYMSNK